jgi:hypothetical protein
MGAPTPRPLAPIQSAPVVLAAKRGNVGRLSARALQRNAAARAIRAARLAVVLQQPVARR